MRRLLLIGLCVLAGPAVADERRIQIVYSSESGSGSEASGGGGVQQPGALFRLAPSSATLDSTISFFVAVVDPFGNIIPNSDVTITYEPIANSGHHLHDNPGRPKGTYDPESGNTGPDGFLPVTYTAPQVSGLIFSHFACVPPGGGPCTPLSGDVEVSIDLATVGCGIQIGQSTTHPINNYGLASLETNCNTALAAYIALFPDGTFTFNDMSLPWGGLFDWQATWSTPHKAHRWGENADFRIIDKPPTHRRFLRPIFEAAGFDVHPESAPPHWHLTTLN